MCSLALGWRVDSDLHPRYWLRQDARPGAHAADDLFQVPAKAIDCHTAIIAQSGSGKSFFLGRLLEEIVLRTRARCIILDPNADFRSIKSVVDESLWRGANYDPARQVGWLPEEASGDSFRGNWQKTPIRIRSGKTSDDSAEQLQLWWPTLPVDIFAHDLQPIQRSELFHCHSFAKLLGDLLGYKSLATVDNPPFIDELDRMFVLARALPRDELLRFLGQEFSLDHVTKAKREIKGEYIKFEKGLVLSSALQAAIARFLASAGRLRDQVSTDVERYYLGKARELDYSGILTRCARPPWERYSSEARIDVIDLPSLDENTRNVAAGAILETEWRQARYRWDEALGEPPERDDRSPTFIVVDEAHNLIPSVPMNRAQESLREQFRRIVAEGRKYGLFLLFVSQRPDKVDPLIFSECENKCIMRIGSRSVLKMTRELMGLEDVPDSVLSRCLEFKVGRALMIGRWSSPDAEIIYSAPRRTVEGGRNLRPEYWASP